MNWKNYTIAISVISTALTLYGIGRSDHSWSEEFLSDENIVWIIIMLWVPAISLFCIMAGAEQLALKAKIEKQLLAIFDQHGFRADFRHFNPTGIPGQRVAGVAVDAKGEKAALIEYTEDLNVRIIPADDIVAVSIVKDGKSVTHTAKQGSIGNALIGGVLFGGAGAIVGASVAKSKSTTVTKIRDIRLHIVISDVANPGSDRWQPA